MSWPGPYDLIVIQGQLTNAAVLISQRGMKTHCDVAIATPQDYYPLSTNELEMIMAKMSDVYERCVGTGKLRHITLE